jgi:hypothetical protein
MQQQQESVMDGSPEGSSMTMASGSQRRLKHPVAEVRRLLLAAAKALPLRRPSWLDKPANQGWR